MKSQTKKAVFVTFPDGSKVQGENVGELHRIFHCLHPRGREMTYPLQIRFTGEEKCGKGVWRQWEKINFLSMEYIVNGSYRFFQDGREYLCQKGDLILMQPRTGNRLESLSGSSEKILTAISGFNCLPMLSRLHLSGCNIIRKIPQKLISLFKQADKLLSEQPPDFELELSVLSYHILLLTATLKRQEEIPPRLQKVLFFIEQAPNGPITPNELCSRFGISASTLFRDFKRHLNQTPVEFITKSRIKQAEQLLQQSDLTIKEIATVTGFGSPYYFSLVFHRYNGQSPSAYRKNCSVPPV